MAGKRTSNSSKRPSPPKLPDPDRNLAAKTSLHVGDLSNVSGNVNIAGGNITTHHTSRGLSADEIRQLFDSLHQAIESRPNTAPADKVDMQADVKEIQAVMTEAVRADQKIDESFLSRRFRNIARVAPDILEVVSTTLASPLAGLGVAVKKIADKAREETGR